MEKWAIDVYWWERPETAHAIARRVERLLISLAAIDIGLSRWDMEPIGNTKKMVPFDVETFARVKLEQDGRSRRDDNGAVDEESGFFAWLLTPYAFGTKKYTGITINAGKYGPFIAANRCSIEIDEVRYDAVRTVEKQCAILRTLVEAWDPDYGLMSSIDLLVERKDEGRRAPKRVPDVGWLTFLPARRGAVPPLAPPASTVSLGELGSIVVASPDLVSVLQPETIEAVDAVQAQLAQAGLLEPEPPRGEVLVSPSG